MTRILCLEGITGAGKTIQSQKISDYLSNYSHLVINEKQYDPFKQTIIDWHNFGANQNFSLEMIKKIAKSRGETHQRYFTPLVGKLDYLIFDRSFYTSGIYQADGKLSPQEIIGINIKKGAIKPERGVILICSPEIALERTETRRKQKNNYLLPSMNETLPEITKRRELYIQLARQYPELYLIDTSNKNEEEVFEEVKLGLEL